MLCVRGEGGRVWVGRGRPMRPRGHDYGIRGNIGGVVMTRTLYS